MIFNHEVIKIQYTYLGYLPSYPAHLISDEEMCEAFLPLDYPIDNDAWAEFLNGDKLSMFRDYYPLLDPAMEPEYRELVSNIAYHLTQFKESIDDDRSIPDWVLSYMNGSVIGPESDIRDIHDLLALLEIDIMEEEFTKEASSECYKVSEIWLRKLPSSQLDHRSPSMFGAPHVIKSLRLSSTEMRWEA